MGMKKLFVIGGMGAGKSTARKVLAEQGVPYIDLDKVGHDVLLLGYGQRRPGRGVRRRYPGR